MMTSLSVITACKNSAAKLTVLYESLARQTYSDFEWLIIDGRSTDGTETLLRRLAEQHPWVRYVSEADGGIYHAINRGLSLANGDYYVVAGDDDEFSPDALSKYAEFASSGNADVVCARVYRAKRVIGGLYPRRAWQGPSRVFAGSHSVGTLIKRRLHDDFGQYSTRFPLLADVYFLKKLLVSQTVNFLEANFIAGTFTEGGATTTNQLQLLAENWQIQMLTERHPLLQMLLFFGKLLVRYPRVADELRGRKASKDNSLPSASG